MAVLNLFVPDLTISNQTRLHAVGRASCDSELRHNLRIVAAILIAKWVSQQDQASDIVGDIVDVAMSKHFYDKGFVKTDQPRLWFCSYIGFEKITSKWAKENHPTCHSYISMRLFNQDERHVEVDSHTIQIYF